METKIVNIVNEMAEYLDAAQLRMLQEVLLNNLSENVPEKKDISNEKYMEMYLEAKQIEGCSKRTLEYYRNTVKHLISYMDEPIRKENVLFLERVVKRERYILMPKQRFIYRII